MSPTVVNTALLLLLPISFAWSNRTYRYIKPKVGVLSQLFCVLCILSFGLVFAFVAYQGATEEAVAGFGRTPYSRYSLTQNPILFWLALSFWYVCAGFALSIVVSGIRFIFLGPSREP